MGFFGRLFSFGKKKRKNDSKGEESWEEIVYNRSEVDFNDQEQRSRYIMNCLEQMSEASNEMDQLSGEYSLVTAYLTDIEEIEALPELQRESVNGAARKLIALDEEIQKFTEREGKLSDTEFNEIKHLEDEIASSLPKIKDAEHMAVLIKKDLRRLDGERSAYEFRKNELGEGMNNLRGMAVIFTTAFVAIMVLLIVMQTVLKMEVFIGYFLSMTAFAIAITAVCVKYIDHSKDRVRCSRDLGKIIQLQNTVKIRYVNNRKLLEYYYLKFGRENGAELEKVWKKYQQEKESRKQFAEIEGKAAHYREQLRSVLASYRVHDPEKWTRRVRPLLDPKEMVEIRHGYILRRQALREQMDYNKNLAETAKNEITEVARLYPAYAKEILEMTEKYGEN